MGLALSEAVTGTDLAGLRELNSLTVVRSLRGHPPATVSELAARTGLSRPSVDVMLQSLAADRWVTVIEPSGSVVGRPARRYQFNSTVGHVLGVDLGAHKVLALLADLDGSVMHSTRRQVNPQAPPRVRLIALDRAISDCVAEAGLSPSDLWQITIGVTGPVDATGRTALFSPLPGWTAVDPVAHFGAIYRCPIQVENDCKLAAVAERWRGIAQDANDIVYLLAGMRTGAGLIIDGALRRGYGGAAGEIGALRAVKWLSAPSHLERCPGVPRTVSADDKAAWVFNAARNGNAAALRAIRRYIRDLAVGAAALVLALDPQVVVLGGGFSRSADLIVDALRRELQHLCLRVPDVRASTLGDESVALGALRLGLDEVDHWLATQGLSSAGGPPTRSAPAASA
jgi:predicted NBD/HSP70 family sugar kinase